MELDNLGNPADLPATTTATSPEAPDDVAGKAPRRGPGAPFGNLNRVVHGQRSQRTKRSGLVHAHLGKRFASAYGHANILRKAIEKLIIEKYGSVSLLHQARIQTILRLEEGCRALELAIRDNPKMGPEELRANRSSISQWTAQKDNALANLLGQQSAVSDPWLAVDAMPRPMPTSDTPSGNDAMADAEGQS